MILLSFTMSLLIFFLLGLSVYDRGVLKSSTMIADSSLSPCRYIRFFPFTNTFHLPSSFIFPNSHVGIRVNEENASPGSGPLRPPPASGLPQAEQNNRSVPLSRLPSLLSLRRDSQIAGLCPVANSLGAAAPLPIHWRRPPSPGPESCLWG